MIELQVTLGILGQGYECVAESGRYFADSGVVIAPDGTTVGEYDSSQEIGTQMGEIETVVSTVETNLRQMVEGILTGTTAA